MGRLAKHRDYTHVPPKIAFWCLKQWERLRETVGADLRCCWCSMDDPCALVWIASPRNTQQLSRSVRCKVGPVQRHSPFPYALLRFQCLAGSDQCHRMGSSWTNAQGRAATPHEATRLSTGVIS